MEVCLRLLKESNKSRFDSYSVRNSVLINPILPLGIVACSSFSDNLSRILGDPGAVSRVRRKIATKVLKYGQKSPWVPTLTELFPKIQADAGTWLGTKKCFVLLCPIGEQFLLSSFREFVHDGYCLATLARFVHQACASKGNFYFLLS